LFHARNQSVRFVTRGIAQRGFDQSVENNHPMPIQNRGSAVQVLGGEFGRIQAEIRDCDIVGSETFPNGVIGRFRQKPAQQRARDATVETDGSLLCEMFENNRSGL